MASFAPFGPENLNPIFVTLNGKDYGTSKMVGKDNVHLKLDMIDETTSNPVNGIAFRQSANYERVKGGQPFDIVIHWKRIRTMVKQIFNYM